MTEPSITEPSMTEPTITEPSMTAGRSADLLERARRIVPGGVNSPVRAFRAVGGTPRFMASAQGPWLTDVDGARYVDLICSWGPMILGHAHPEVLAAVQAAAAKGFSFGTPSENELLLAEEIVRRVEPVEQIRLVSSGTEATMSAIRLARGFTGRTLVVKFAGCYHGHVDSLLAAAGSGVATLALPDSAGVPAESAAETIVLPFNDVPALDAVFAERGDQIAAVITEAAAGNMGVVPPAPGFTAALRSVTRRYGALLISDEVMTGFRCSPSGWFGLEGPVADGMGGTAAPDLFTFGKVMGGGFPAAAFGGRADVMAMLAPEGPVYQAGTLSGNPVATAAGLATLQHCTDDVYAHLDRVAHTLADAAGAALDAAGVAHTVQWAGSMFSIFFRENEVRNYDDAKDQDTAAFGRFFHAMCAPAAERVRVVVRQHRPRRRGRRDGPEGAALGRPRGRVVTRTARPEARHSGRFVTITAMSAVHTRVHLLRHGEVFNPEKILYGRLPGFLLSELGHRMARMAADDLSGRDIVHLVSSPLERAQQTAQPLVDDTGLELVIDDRVIEAGNRFEGRAVAGGQGLLKLSHLPLARNPFRPSWGEPYTEIRDRMIPAVWAARDAARGHEAVIVSHQLPIWTTRLSAERRPLWHDPRRRECTLASVTTVLFDEDDRLVGTQYFEPAASLLPIASKVAGA